MFTYTKAKQIVENIKLGYIEQIVDECELEINNIEGLYNLIVWCTHQRCEYSRVNASF